MKKLALLIAVMMVAAIVDALIVREYKLSTFIPVSSNSIGLAFQQLIVVLFVWSGWVYAVSWWFAQWIKASLFHNVALFLASVITVGTLQSLKGFKEITWDKLGGGFLTYLILFGAISVALFAIELSIRGVNNAKRSHKNSKAVIK